MAIILSGTYEVSSLGRVRRAAPGRLTHVGRLLNPVILKIGYPFVRPVVNGKNVGMYVHRLVAEAFLGPCPEGCEVNHKDGDKANPALSNLEYVTHAENMRHASRSMLLVRGESHGGSKLTEADVRSIRSNWKDGQSISSIARARTLSTATVFNIVKRKLWKHVP